jgi:DNA repair protein REV1
MMSYADDLQAVSVDEALLEVTSRVRAAEDAAAADIDPASQLQDQALALAEVIRARVKHATGCIGMYVCLQCDRRPHSLSSRSEHWHLA